MTIKKPVIGVIADRPYWMVYASIAFRAIHQFGAAIFIATYFLVSPGTRTWQMSLAVTVVSGLLLLGVEAIRHRQFLREMFGLTTIFKLVLIGLGHHCWLPALPTVSFAFLLASLVSHAPKAIRHRLII